MIFILALCLVVSKENSIFSFCTAGVKFSNGKKSKVATASSHSEVGQRGFFVLTDTDVNLGANRNGYTHIPCNKSVLQTQVKCVC